MKDMNRGVNLIQKVEVKAHGQRKDGNMMIVVYLKS